MKRIEELTKEELLSLIYHHLPRTMFFDHPVICAACGTDRLDHFTTVNGRVVMPLGYICDNCEGK